ncbi:zf-CCHC domain-containing protein [Tanacetum coccineum]
MCNTAKEIWKTLLITHQRNSQVKDNKIGLFVQQYEQFFISEDESIDSAFARFNTIITSLKALDEGYSSKNYVRKFLRALHPKWRAKVTTIEESKDLTSLSLDELIGNLKVHEMIIKKDSEIVKEKVERKSIALKAKKESSDEECSTSGSKDEEYAMANGKSDRKCFRCGDPNHLIGECPKPPKDKNQRAFVGGSWSDSGEEDDEKVKDETCLVAHASSEVCSESSYFSDENSSIDDLALDNEYDKLCKMSLKIITKNKRLKATRNSLENELRKLKDKLSILEKNKGVDLDCAKCHALKIENEKLKEESTRLNKFEKSTHCLNEMLSNQKPSGDKLGLGFNSFEASSSGTKEIKFVKAQKKAYSDGGPINMGGPLNDQAAPKIIMGPPPATPGSEKTVSFQKSILGPRPKHIIVNKAKVPVASDNEVKQFYKPLSKPGVGFSKPNFRSKTPPPRRVNNNYSRPKTPQPKRHVGRQNQPHGFPICLGVDLEPDEWIKDSGCSKHMTGNRKLFSTYKAYNGGNVIFGSNLRGNIIGKGQICDNKCRVTFSEHDNEITKDGKVIDVGLERVEAKGGRPISRHRFSSSSLGKLVLVTFGVALEPLSVTDDLTTSPDLTLVLFARIYHEPSILCERELLWLDLSGIDNPCCLGMTLGQISIRALSYRELGCIRRTARISILPIEPNLAERARISAINLDDYQLDPVTPPPSPSSPFMMAAYQRMITETDPTQREEALTETGQNSVPDVKPRVEESSLETLSMDELITQLRQMCEDAEDRASNAQEEARQKRKEALEEVSSKSTVTTTSFISVFV